MFCKPISKTISLLLAISFVFAAISVFSFTKTVIAEEPACWLCSVGQWNVPSPWILICEPIFEYDPEAMDPCWVEYLGEGYYLCHAEGYCSM